MRHVRRMAGGVLAAMLAASTLLAAPAAAADREADSLVDPLVALGNGDYQWGALTVRGVDWDGNVAVLKLTNRWQDDVIGVDGGRWDDQIDYDVDRGGEMMVIDFPSAASDIVLTVGMLGPNEGGSGNDEAGVWRAYNAAGTLIGSGAIDPDVSALGPRLKERGYGQYPIEISASSVVRLELEAIDWDAAGSDPGRNNSDFGVVSIDWSDGGTVTPPTTAPPTTAPPTTAPSTTAPPTTPPSQRRSVDGTDLADVEGIDVTAFAYDGSAASFGSRRGSLGVDGGRYDFQLDFDAATERSERMVLTIPEGAVDVVIDIDMMSSAEWNGLDETGRWLARSPEGDVIGQGELDPSAQPSRSFPITASGIVGSVELTATAYGGGVGLDRTTNNSDFAIASVAWTPAGAAPPTTAPPTTAPPTTAPPTTAPSTFAPSTTAPPTGERVTLDGDDRSGALWGSGVTIAAFDDGGASVAIGERRGVFAPASGRYDYQLDFDAERGRSETMTLTFASPVSDIELGLRHLEAAEWRGMDETGRWTAFDAAGNEVGSGFLEPGAANNSPTASLKTFDLTATAPVSSIRIEALAYDRGVGVERTSNNSDFAVATLSYQHGGGGGTAGSNSAVTAPSSGSTTVDPGHHHNGPAAVAVATGAWADPSTWGGVLPSSGQSVMIPAGVEVVLDETPAPIGPLMIAGTLTLADTDLDITVDSVMVAGHLRAGSETEPFDSRLTVTLAGTHNHGGHGSRALAVMAGGELDLHGASAAKKPWTVLDGSVSAGASQLTVADSTGWEVGDRIVLAPTGVEAFEDEVVTITSIDGRRVTFEPALAFDHHGEVEVHAGIELDMRGEIGLLSHNIVVTSPAGADATLRGGHIMVMAGGEARVEGVELHRLGQTGNAGRYPFHWHQAGDVAGQYIRNSSVHATFQRGVVIHGTDNALVEGVVAHDTFSHAFVWSEDGNEWGNQLVGNLAVRVNNVDKNSGLISFPRTGRNGQPTLQISAQAETRSSGFWGRNPENTLIGNHVAGVDHGQGFFYDTRHMGYALRQNMKTPRAEIIFDDNTAHTIEGTSRGFYNYGPAARGHGVFVTTYVHHPVIEVRNFTSYHAVTGAWIEDENTVLVDSIVADSAGGALIHHAEVRSTVFVGPTGNDVDRTIGLLADRQVGGGVHITNQGKGKAVRLTDVTFVGVDRAGIVVRYAGLDELSSVSGLTFIDTDPILALSNQRRPVSGSIQDLDGTLCGNGPSTINLGSAEDPC